MTLPNDIAAWKWVAIVSGIVAIALFAARLGAIDFDSPPLRRRLSIGLLLMTLIFLFALMQWLAWFK